MAGSLTLTAQNTARPPYMALAYDSGASTTKVYSVAISRDGSPVRVSANPSPARAITWKDYDAPYDQVVTYVATIGVATTPTGNSNEDWTGTLSSKGWTSITNLTQGATTVRTNLCGNPSFETDVTTNWTVIGAATKTRVTTEHYLGSAAMSLTANPTTVTNQVTDPLVLGSNPGWTIGAGSTGAVTYGSGVVTASPLVTAAGRAYLNSPHYSVTPGQTIQIGATLTRNGLAGACGLMYRFYTSGNVQIGSDAEMLTGTMADGATQAVARSMTVPATASYIQLFPFSVKTAKANFPTVGTTSYLGSVMVGSIYVNNAAVAFFSGSSVDTDTYQYDWTGTTNASTSTRKAAVLNAGAEVAYSSIIAGRMMTIQFRAKTNTGAGVLTVTPVWSSGAGPAVAMTTALTSSWQQFYATVPVPATAGTGGSFQITLDNLGFGSKVLYLDAVMIEQTDTLLPYFDGSANEFPTSTLGTWSGAWVGTTGLSTSTASYNHTIKQTSVGTTASLNRTYTFPTSGVQFEGFYLPKGSSFSVAIQMGTTTVTLTGVNTVPDPGPIWTISDGSTSATLQRAQNFSGALNISLINGVASLNFDNGTSISINTTISQITKVTIALIAGAVMMPFSLIPGVVQTTETYTVSGVLSPAGAWLIHPYTPSLSMEIDAGQACGDVFATVDSADSVSRPAPVTLLAPIGSRRQVAVSIGPRKDPSWSLELSTKTGDAYDAVIALFDDNAPLRFDYPDDLNDNLLLCSQGMRVPKGWFSPGDITETRDIPNWASPLRRWGVPLEPVRTPVAIPTGS